MADRPAWAGAVLTGGASTRMGTDKATLLVDGTPMAGRVAAALEAAGAVEVARIGGAASDVADDHPGEGPLGGALTALRWCDEQLLVVAPCDLLAPDPAAIGALVAALLDAPGALAAVPAADRPLPLALRTSALEPLAAAFASGERSLHRALAPLAVVSVALDPAALADADTPEDLPDDPPG